MTVVTTDENVPEVTSLDEIYSTVDQRARYQAITDTFVEKYGSEPEFMSRSPGRVNLIGEVCIRKDFSLSDTYTDIS